MSILSSSLDPKQSFHATFTTNISGPSPAEDCTLHLLHVLPADCFVDLYQLKEHHNAFSFHLWGTSNLELPTSAVPLDGSVLLINASWPEDDPREDHQVTVRVPLHMRYTRPKQDMSFRPVNIPWPLGFWVCSARGNTQGHVQDNPLAYIPSPFVSPFNLSAVALFAIHPTSSSPNPVEIVYVAAGNPNDLVLVEIGTVTVVAMTAIWILYRSWSTASRLSTLSNQVKTE